MDNIKTITVKSNGCNVTLVFPVEKTEECKSKILEMMRRNFLQRILNEKENVKK